MPTRVRRRSAPRTAIVAPPEPAPSRPGRPPKFGRRARPVTITLPEDLIDRLRARHVDLGRVIVEALEAEAEAEGPVQLA
jgi:hypothetical protein